MRIKLYSFCISEKGTFELRRSMWCCWRVPRGKFQFSTAKLMIYLNSFIYKNVDGHLLSRGNLNKTIRYKLDLVTLLRHFPQVVGNSRVIRTVYSFDNFICAHRETIAKQDLLQIVIHTVYSLLLYIMCQQIMHIIGFRFMISCMHCHLA